MAQTAPAAKKASPRKTRPAAKAAAGKAPAPRQARLAAPVAPAAAVADKDAKAGKPAAKDGEARKVKLVRDSFTIPKTEYATLDALKARAAKAGLPGKKSEVLRAGIMVLAAMGDAAFQAAMNAVPTLKTGRPKKG